MNATDDYWMTYLGGTGAREDKLFLQKENIRENANQVLKLSIKEREELQRVLLMCSEEIKTWLSPLIACPVGHCALYGLLSIEKQKSEGNYIQQFKERLEKDEQIREHINDLLSTINDSADSLSMAYENTRKAAAAPMTLQDIQKINKEHQKKTWKDIPEDELAERLSKGEIIGRDEWIPGISKGRRQLKDHELSEHMDFGKRIQKEGNTAFAKKDYSLALTRYTQGVHLLDWIESAKEELTRQVDDMLTLFYKNQAQAAILSGEYQIAIRACTSALKLDPHDGKALYRRAQANIYLGDLVAAKNDYKQILKSPFCSTESKMAAHNGFKEMRKIVYKWKEDVTKIMESATQETFSQDRPPIPLPNSMQQQMEKQPSFSESINMSPQDELRAPPQLSLEETKEFLEQLLDLYTSKEAQEILIPLRKAADFEEKRVLIRSKKILPSLIGPLLDEWNFEGATFIEKKTSMERCVAYWRLKDSEVKSLVQDIYSTFLGDFIED